MTEPGASRPGLLPAELHESLLEYLRFRHVFRDAYSFELDWQKLSPLVLRLEQTLQQLEDALEVFLAKGGTHEQAGGG